MMKTLGTTTATTKRVGSLLQQPFNPFFYHTNINLFRPLCASAKPLAAHWSNGGGTNNNNNNNNNADDENGKLAPAIYAWPSVSQYNDLLDSATTNADHLHSMGPNAPRIRFIDSTTLGHRVDSYEQRIYTDGIVTTRPENYHDFFNMLVWRTFPKTKRMLNYCQIRFQNNDPAAAKTTKLRTTQQNFCTHFDESGAVIISRDEELSHLFRTMQWKRLFYEKREQFCRNALVFLVGHALYERALLQPSFLGLTAKTVLLDLDDANQATRQYDHLFDAFRLGGAGAEHVMESSSSSSTAAADEQQQQQQQQQQQREALGTVDDMMEMFLRKNDFGALQQPREHLLPLPIFGVPFFWTGAGGGGGDDDIRRIPPQTSAEFYDNHPQYFRSSRKGVVGNINLAS